MPEASTKLTTKDLLDQLSGEYRILQDKIDKIGAFKFTIRGWSITIVIASCIGATTERLPSPFLLLGLIVFVIVFWAMEYIQTGYRDTFGRRCAEIERLIWRLLRTSNLHVSGMVPRIAHDLADDNRSKFYRWENPRVRGFIRGLSSQGDVVFYVVQVVVVIALTVWLAYHARAQRASSISPENQGSESTATAQKKQRENHEDARDAKSEKNTGKKVH
jgi:hypothetical protein